jgi:hypothetical protein
MKTETKIHYINYYFKFLLTSSQNQLTLDKWLATVSSLPFSTDIDETLL